MKDDLSFDVVECLRGECIYEFNVKTEDLKQYIISWLYGNHMNEIKPNPFYEKFGYEKLEMMKNNEILVGIYKEIIKGRKIIVDNHTIGKNRIKNIMGKEFSSTKLKSKTLLSYPNKMKQSLDFSFVELNSFPIIFLILFLPMV
jgi:hypothetical protein